MELNVIVKRVNPFAVILLCVLAACSSSGVTDTDISDPLEPTNRAVHSVNKGLDRVILRPASQAYGYVTPDPAERLVGNATANLGVPASAINKLLQGDILASLKAVGRFGVNSTLGILGLFDPASGMGLVPEPTDFGETLYTWGVGEGPYVELPVLGPKTTRGAVGTVVDFAINPLNTLVPAPQSDYILAARALEVVDLRKKLGPTLDSVLYGSADSYAAARRAYLDNRRRTLKGSLDADDLDDPFAFDE